MEGGRTRYHTEPRCRVIRFNRNRGKGSTPWLMLGAMEGRRRVTIETGDAAFTVRYAATADAAVGPVVVVGTADAAVTQTDDVVGRRSQGTQTASANDKRLELEQTRLDEYKKRRHPDGGDSAPQKRRPPDQGSYIG